MIPSACFVLRVNTVRIMDLPCQMVIVMLGTIALRARMYHSPPTMPAARAISVRLEVGTRRAVHQECINPTGLDPIVIFVQLVPTVKHLVSFHRNLSLIVL